MPLQRGEVLGYDFNRMVVDFKCYYQTVLGRGGFCRPNPFPGTPYGTGYTWSGSEALELRRVRRQ